MLDGEQRVLAIFRQYRVRPYQMLFLNANAEQRVQRWMAGLVSRGLVIRERHMNAYHLTTACYEAVLALPRNGDNRRMASVAG